MRAVISEHSGRNGRAVAIESGAPSQGRRLAPRKTARVKITFDNTNKAP
jgi:hypothetical protein